MRRASGRRSIRRQARHLSTTTFAALVLVAVACQNVKDEARNGSQDEPLTPRVAEVEPNGERAQAQVVEGAAVIDGRFEAGKAPDADWFRIPTTFRSIVRFELQAGPESGARLEIVDADGRALSQLAVDAGATNILPNVTCEKACFAKASAVAKTGSTYTLGIHPSAPHSRSEREPNDARGTAQPLAPGGIVDGYLAPTGDEDWYVVSPGALSRGEALSFALTPPATVRAELSVFGPDGGEPLATWRAPAPGEALRMRNLSPPGGFERPFYLVVRGARGGERGRGAPSTDPNTPYSLELRTAALPSDSEIEPNDFFSNATPLSDSRESGNHIRTGTLAPMGDVDWYVFDVSTPSMLRAEVSGVDGVDVALSVHCASGSGEPALLLRVDDGGPGEPEILAGVPVPSGKCWLRVEGGGKEGAGAQGNATAAYALLAAMEPDDGGFEREPNDRVTNATPLEIGGSVRGHLHPARDVDLFRLEVTEPTDVVLQVSGVPRLDLSLLVRDTSETDARGAHPVIGSVDRNRVEGDERLVIPFEPGVYIVEIRSKGGASNPRQTYSLTAK